MGFRFSFDSLLNRSLPEMVGISNDDPVAARMRADQLRTVKKITPLMMMANVFNALIVAYFLHAQPGGWFMPYWAAFVVSIAALGMVQWYASREKKNVKFASRRGVKRFARSAFIFGALWGCIPAILYPSVDQGGGVILIAVVGGMMGGGAMSLYIVPSALTAWLIGISAGCGIGLARGGDAIDLATLALLCGYTLTLMRAAETLAISYGQNLLNVFTLEEKSETINVLLKEFSEGSSDWLWQTDAAGKLVHGADGFAEHLGTVPKCFCIEPRERCDDFVKIKGAKQIRDHWLDQTAFTDVQVSAITEGVTRWASVSGKPIHDDNGNFTGFRGVAQDITAAKQSEERIAYLAHNDALTGLVNRTHFSRAVTSHLQKADPETIWAVMFLDLDGFKLVNDRNGHSVGDELLEAVAGRIKKNCEDSDVVARLGGDEFAILCRKGRSIQALSAKAERLIAEVQVPYDLPSGNSVSGIGLSVGVAIGTQDGTSEEQLLHNADLALYRAKNEGRGTYRFFEIEMDEIVRQRRIIEQDLREALAKNQFSLKFQPLVGANDGSGEGFEALLRWHHPDRGVIPPSEFIPIAETMGLISDIGDWVLHEACRKAVEWPDHYFVAVNLSPQQFQQGRIIKSVTSALVTSGLQPHRLELEVTEGLLMDNTEQTTYVLRELRGMGVSIALDDFGTGYSSLSYLLKFPFDKLKIDRSFISAIEDDDIARNVLEAIAKLGSVLDLKITAEGVETTHQVNVLKQFNCTHFQGYLFGKPLDDRDLAAYMMHDWQSRNDGLAGKTRIITPAAGGVSGMADRAERRPTSKTALTAMSQAPGFPHRHKQ